MNMNMILRVGSKLSNDFSKVSSQFKFLRCAYPFQRINYGTTVREPDGDVFGNSIPQSHNIGKIVYEREEKDEIFQEPIPQNLVMKKIDKAIRVLDFDGALNIYKDFVTYEKPNHYMIRLLLSCGARLGKAKETFSLFQDVKKRGFTKIHPSMYTSLLYACANCEDSKIALRISKTVMQYVIKTNEKPSLIHCKALLLVFTKHGDMKSAFNFVDHLVKIKSPVNTDIYNTLIEICCSNKEYGLRLAVLLYHKMVSQKQLPDIFTFAVIAKCVRDCNFGDSLLTQELIKYLFEGHFSKTVNKLDLTNFSLALGIKKEPQIDDNIIEKKDGENHFIDGMNEEMKLGGDLITMEDVEAEGLTSAASYRKDKKYEMTYESINILKPKPLNNVHVNFNELSKCENRFMMFGGPKGFLEVMSDFNVEPNIRLFSVLLQCLPSNCEAEEELCQEMKKFNIKMDIYFFNILLDRMIKRNELKNIEDYFNFVEKNFGKPDLWTIGALSQICDRKERVVKLIEFARSHKIRPSSFILKTLLQKSGSDLETLFYVKKIAEEEQIDVKRKVYAKMKKLNKNLKNMENGKEKKIKKTESFA